MALFRLSFFLVVFAHTKTKRPKKADEKQQTRCQPFHRLAGDSRAQSNTSFLLCKHRAMTCGDYGKLEEKVACMGLCENENISQHQPADDNCRSTTE